MAVHIALHERAIRIAPAILSAEGDTHSAFLAINPAGKMPTLLVDGRPLTEVAGCLFYLARRFPEARLSPGNDIDAQAQAVSWMSVIASTLHPARRQGAWIASPGYGAWPTASLAIPVGHSAPSRSVRRTLEIESGIGYELPA